MSLGDVLIIGGDSNIGKRLSILYKSHGLNVITTSRKQESVNQNNFFLDLSQDISKWEIPSFNIKIVFFCASITSIDFCNKNPDYTKLVNVINTVLLIKKIAKLGVYIVYISSNSVFDGNTPFAKGNDFRNPKTEYGKQKVLVENEVSKLGDNIGLVRVSKVLFNNIPLFNNWISELKKGNEIKAYSDMYFSPISLDFFIQTLFKITQMKLSDIIQISASDQISYFDAIMYLTKKYQLNEKLITTRSYKQDGISFSPSYSTLDCSRLINLGILMPNSYESLIQFID